MIRESSIRPLNDWRVNERKGVLTRIFCFIKLNLVGCRSLEADAISSSVVDASLPALVRPRAPSSYKRKSSRDLPVSDCTLATNLSTLQFHTLRLRGIAFLPPYQTLNSSPSPKIINLSLSLFLRASSHLITLAHRHLSLSEIVFLALEKIIRNSDFKGRVKSIANTLLLRKLSIWGIVKVN